MKSLPILSFVLLITIILIIPSGCDRCGGKDCANIPDDLRLRYISSADSTDLINSGYYHQDSISIYYNDAGVKQNVALQFVPIPGTSKVVIQSLDIAFKSAEGIKTFFIALNKHDIDTIYLDVAKVTEDCCTGYPLKAFKYNGQVMEMNNKEYTFLIRK